MTTTEINLNLRRPAAVPPARWTEVLMAACCQRRVPNLRSFSIDVETCRLSISVPGTEQASGLALDFDAIAALVGEPAAYQGPSVECASA